MYTIQKTKTAANPIARNSMKKFFILILLVSCSICHAQDNEVYKKYGDRIFAWYKTDWEGAHKAQNDTFLYPFSPKYILGNKDGEFLVYAHRHIICPFCGFDRTICFIGPFKDDYSCEKCGRKYDEKMGLYKWEHLVKNKAVP